MNRHESDRAMTVPEAAEYLGISPLTLYNWRALRKGPTGYRMGVKIIYRLKQLQAWMELHKEMLTEEQIS